MAKQIITRSLSLKLTRERRMPGEGGVNRVCLRGGRENDERVTLTMGQLGWKR